MILSFSSPWFYGFVGVWSGIDTREWATVDNLSDPITSELCMLICKVTIPNGLGFNRIIPLTGSSQDDHPELTPPIESTSDPRLN
ncbi:hypothetical protein MJO28_016042 [Puccinia striiformis f. sp. tritici]|uniref:Uncharacterized protein n=1 Tax=Puccinia striiformis f. sp. tritici TaxID=168172 RepID=A0ACC0DQK7_9BASI|nr:hypothetical protein MJO28_016042 [Puccinia striiformis f. sp. tritici]